MAGEGGGYLNEIKYLINAKTYVLSTYRYLKNAIDFVNQF